MQTISYLLFLIVGFYQLANSQILRFGSKLDGSGNLVMVDTIFRLETTPQIIYAKLFSKTPLVEDTFFIVLKNLHGSNKFLMKRSTNKMDALAHLKVKEDGIYKVFVINPKTKQTLVSKKLYITSAVNPTVQALKNDYQKQLSAQNQMKNESNINKFTTTTKPNINTNKNNSTNNNVVKPNANTPSQNTQFKPTQKDDLDDLDDDDDLDANIDEGNIEIDLDDKEDDLSDFDDAD